MSKVPEGRRSRARFLARMLPGAVAAPIGGFLPPCLTIARRLPPKGRGWLHEILFEGLRIQAQVQEGRVALFDVAGAAQAQAGLARIAAAFAGLPANRVAIDGIVVVQTAAGASDLAALRADLAAGRGDRVIFFAFDLLHLDGFDVRAAPLAERKRVLAALLGEAGEGPLAFSAHVEGEGRDFLSEAEALGLAGMVAKRADAPYRAGPGGDWLAIAARPRGGARAARPAASRVFRACQSKCQTA